MVRQIDAEDKPIRAIAWAPDSNRLATWDFANVVIWNAETGKSLMRFPTSPTPSEDSTEHSMSWHPISNRLFTAASRNIAIWNPLTGQRLHLVEDVPTVAEWSPDGRRIVTKNQWSGTVLVDLSNPQEPVKRELPFAEVAAWSPDGSRFATGDWHGLVRVRDAESGKELLYLPGHAQTGLTSLSWHPDGSRIASASVLGTIKIWDVQAGEELLTMREHAGPVNAVRFNSDGTALASVGEDGKLNVWDASTGHARGQSKQLLASLERKDLAHAVDAEDLQVRARIHCAAGNWDQAATDFERAAEMLGRAAPKWFDTAEWVIGPYPANLQQSYPPEEIKQFDARRPLPGVAAGETIPVAQDLRWQLAEPSLREGVNLSMHIGIADQRSAYALTRVYAPHEVNVTALIGASRFDEHRVWHNGELIYEDLQKNVEGRWPDEGNVAVTLRKGWNTFLIKIVNIPFRERRFYLYFRLSNDPAFLAQAYERVADSQRAHVALNGFLQEHPDHAQLCFTRAVTHLRLGDLDHAGPDLRKATQELGPIRVANLFRECNGDRLIEVISDAISLTPENTDLRAVRADWLTRAGRWEEALKDERVLATVDKFTSRADQLALLLAVAGHAEEYQQHRPVLLEALRAMPRPSPDDVITGLVQPASAEELQQIESIYTWFPTLAVSALSDPHGAHNSGWRACSRIDGRTTQRRLSC